MEYVLLNQNLSLDTYRVAIARFCCPVLTPDAVLWLWGTRITPCCLLRGDIHSSLNSASGTPSNIDHHHTTFWGASALKIKHEALEVPVPWPHGNPFSICSVRRRWFLLTVEVWMSAMRHVLALTGLGEEMNWIVVWRLQWCTSGHKSSFTVSRFSVDELELWY